MIDVERQKLLDAIEFFARHTKHFGLVKMFKLLYYLDMIHFRETGRTVTGLRYNAWKWGPVPPKLFTETRKPEPDFAAVARVERPPKDDPDNESPKLTAIVPLAKRDRTYMTVREKRIADEVADIFNEVKAEMISDISHAKNGPWDIAWKKGEGTPIDFFDSLNLKKIGSGQPVSLNELRERVADYRESGVAR